MCPRRPLLRFNSLSTSTTSSWPRSQLGQADPVSYYYERSTRPMGASMSSTNSLAETYPPAPPCSYWEIQVAERAHSVKNSFTINSHQESTVDFSPMMRFQPRSPVLCEASAGTQPRTLRMEQ